MQHEYTCDCGKLYTPNPKYKDFRVKCTECIRQTSAAEVKAKCVKYLGGRCVDCGFSGHPVAFDFDHKNPLNKSFKISGNYIFRWHELQKELHKCQLRCATCHRLRHYFED
jgi:hypothetical protein